MNSNYLLAAAALALAVGCSGRDAAIGNGTGASESATVEAPAPLPPSNLQMADPAAASYLLSGFHDVEQNAWRWTARKFSARVAPPADPAGPVQLKFRFAISEVMIERLKSVRLSASANGHAVGSESYDDPGEHVFQEALPAGLAPGPLRIDFELDRAIPAGVIETRELGVIAVSLSLE